MTKIHLDEVCDYKCNCVRFTAILRCIWYQLVQNSELVIQHISVSIHK